MTALDVPPDLADRHRGGDRRGGRAWALTAVVTGPPVLGYLLVATVLALITAWVPGSGFSVPGVFAAAAPAWLAACQVPLVIGGAPLGALPLLPTLGLMALVARAANRAAWRLGHRTAADARLIITAVGLTNALAGVVLALAVSGPGLSVSAAQAALGCGAVSVAAATLGVAGPCRLFPALTGELDPAVRRGVRAGLIGLLGLVAAGLGIVLLGLVLSLGSVARLFAHTAPGAASGFGLLLLCLGYLPNAAVAGMSFLAGPGFSLGLVDLSVAGLHGGPLPAVPLVAALPAGSAPWWPVGLLVPAAAGALVGWWARRSAADPQARLRVVGVAAGVAAVAGFLLASLAGGRLGNGPFDPVRFPAGLFAVAVFCWIAVPGAAVAWLAGPRAPRAAARTTNEQSAEDRSVEGVAGEQGHYAEDGSAGAAAGPDDHADPGPDENTDDAAAEDGSTGAEAGAAATDAGTEDENPHDVDDPDPAAEFDPAASDPEAEFDPAESDPELAAADLDLVPAARTEEDVVDALAATEHSAADLDPGGTEAAAGANEPADRPTDHPSDHPADDGADRARERSDDHSDQGAHPHAGTGTSPGAAADREHDVDSPATGGSAEPQAESGPGHRPATGRPSGEPDWAALVDDEWDEFDAMVDAEARAAAEPPPDDTGWSGPATD